MNWTKKQTPRRRKHTLLSGIGVAVALGLGLLLLSQALPGEVASQPTEHTVIGLPNVDIIALQHINTGGFGDSTEATIEFAAPAGDVLETSTSMLRAESVSLYTGPDDPTDMARIGYDQSPGGDERVIGANYRVSVSGNAAYLGLEWGSAGRAQSGAFRILVMWLNKKAWGWTSEFVLQNRSGQDAASLVIDFYDQSGNPACFYHEASTIPPNGSTSFYLGDIDCLSDGFMGTAVISADQPVAVSSVSSYNAELGIGSAYQGITSEWAATELVVPALFKDHNLQTSTICIANLGAAATDISVEYSDGLVDNATVPPVASYCRYQGTEDHETGWAGGAVIRSSGEPLAAVVSVWAENGGTIVGRWMYNAIPPHLLPIRTEGSGLAFPLLFNDADDWTSEIHLYNVGASLATIVPRYVSSSPSGFVYCAEPFTIPAGGMVSLSQADLPPLFDQGMAYFSVTQSLVASAVSVTSDQPLGEIDRHFGYRAAYLFESITFPDTCDTIHQVFLPITSK